MKTLLTEAERRVLREAAKRIDSSDLSNAVMWYAQAVKKVRLWTTLVEKHSGVSVQRRHWREATVGQSSIPYWEWVGLYLSDQTEDYNAAAIRAVAQEFVKKAGLVKGRTVDDAIRALLHGWDMTHGKRHGY